MFCELVEVSKVQQGSALLRLFFLLAAVPLSGCLSSEYLISKVEGGQGKERLRPSFKTDPRVYKEEEGSTALLLCKVNNLGDSVIVWKQPDRIISAGMGLIRKDKRLSLIGHADGIYLEIKHLDQEDAGNYICEVENSGEPILQTNQLQVLVPPKISTSHSGSSLTVRKDSSITLSCNGSGFPVPRISWQRQYQMLPNGEKLLESSSLRFHKVDRSDSGVYICTADNGVGSPVSATINLNVIYAPEIEIDKRWVHGGIGQEAVISCLVYGDPDPQVRWYRETMLLDRNEERIMEQFGHRNRLVITQLSPEDFGNYSCLAENELGKSRGTIQLSGKPNAPVVMSSSHGGFSDKYKLSWSVESFSTIYDFRILYRKFISSTDPAYDTRSRWITVVPDLPAEDPRTTTEPFSLTYYRHEGSYMFFAMEPNTKYEVMVQAENEHGWGDYSELFIFSTRAIDDVPKELPVESMEPKVSDPDWTDMVESGLKSGSVSGAGPGGQTVHRHHLLIAIFLFFQTS